MADDLWSALTAQALVDNVDLPVDVRTIMNTWTLKMVFGDINLKKMLVVISTYIRVIQS